MGKKIYIFLFLVVALSLVIVFTLHYKFNSNFSQVVAPVPNYLNLSDNNQVSTISLWIPTLTNYLFGKSSVPQISAKSAFIYDTTTGKVLYSKNPVEKLPMASLTKIMTAIVGLEHQKADDEYLVTQSDLVGEDSMGLTAGEKLSLQDLLYGLVLHSGNDAAETIASNYPGGRAVFIKAMNDKAKSLGLSNTNFTNPTGLEGDGNQYTTAYDLSVMTRYALIHFPLFDKVVATFDYTIPSTKTHKEYILENETNLISSYPGVKGVKDGYTPEAGLCLVTYLDYGGHKIIAVILGSDNRRQEMKDLLDYSLNSIGIAPPNHG